MCGILGFLDNKPLDQQVFSKMLNALNHRGPDDSGIWKDESNGFFIGHNRLSIQDLSPKGHQPMISDSSRYVISFNGEIYNHLSLRKEINFISNVKWRGNSDTETILKTVETYGINIAINKLKGMFAFSIYDTFNKELYLVRDRFGEKPLFYGSSEKKFFFSSDIRVLNFINFKKHLSSNALDMYLKYGYIPSPFGIYKEINKVDPGQIVKINLKNLQITKKKYFDFYEHSKNFNIDYSITKENILEKFEKNLYSSISSQTISDVGFGVFLSSGVDSVIIASLLAKNYHKKIDTFTIKINDKIYDESSEADEISKYINTNFHIKEINESNLIEKIDILSDVYDEPFADSSQIPTLLLCENSVKLKKVFLTGDGGDEILGGYNRHTQVSKFYNLNNSLKYIILYLLKLLNLYDFNIVYKYFSFLLPKNLKSSIPDTHLKKIILILNSNNIFDAYEKIISIWPEKFDIQENKILHQRDGFNFNEKMIINDTLNYLPNDIFCKVDRASMFYSLETRSPYVDYDFVNFYQSIPKELKNMFKSKLISKKILEKFLPKKLIYKPKKGFGIPMKKWLNGPLKDFLNDNLGSEINELNNIFNYKVLNKNRLLNIRSHEEAYKIWSILVFQLWKKKNL